MSILGKLKIPIRWMIRRDFPEVLEIERVSFEFPWDEEEFLTCLRQRNCIGMVAEINHEIVGFMIYELHKSMLRVLNFAVAPEFRRQSVGSRLSDRLISKLNHKRREEIIIEVRETNLAAQLFFRSQGFRAVRTLRNFYDHGDVLEDAYHMSYRLAAKEELVLPPRNRMTEFL